MPIMYSLKFALQSLLYQLPVILVLVAALAVLVFKWSKMPRAALWALLGFGLLLALILFMPFVYQLLSRFLIDSHAIREWLFPFVRIVQSLLDAAAMGLLLMAVLAGRGNQRT